MEANENQIKEEDEDINNETLQVILFPVDKTEDSE